ncbi:MAG: T9SS type A sorting domain-containing protein, partial [Bacteroidales bacterium]|nr:T9SS type A sorting domain-containing protein [Bacteroidales bacterium]
VSNDGIFVDFRTYLGDIPSELLNVCVTAYRGDCSVSDCEEFLYHYWQNSGIDSIGVDGFNFTNPVTNGKLQFDSDVTGNYEIFSLEGRLLDCGFVSGCEIDVSQLKNGVYMIRIGEKTEKFVVNN